LTGHQDLVWIRTTSVMTSRCDFKPLFRVAPLSDRLAPLLFGNQIGCFNRTAV